MSTIKIAVITAALVSLPALAHDVKHNAGPDGHAPIGVMGDHTHKAGEWMTSYRYMTMQMKGSLDGSDGISNEQILQDFRVTPTKMTTQMHMFGLMYAPTDWVTLTAMVPYVIKDMDHVRMGGQFSTRTEGQGDLKLGGLFQLSSSYWHSLHLNAQVSLPTGQIDEDVNTPMGRSRAPFPMQLGSGTYDIIIGATLRGQNGNYTWGMQGLGTFRTGENDNGYTLGDMGEFNLWNAWRFSDLFSGSMRLKATAWSDIDGNDAAYAMGQSMNLVPTIFPNIRSGNRTDLLFGGNWITKTGHRFAIEWGFPIQQHLSGPQLEADSTLTVGWQKAF